MIELQIRRLSVIADDSGDQLVLMDALPYKEAIHWTCIEARDLTTKTTRIDIVLMQARIEFVLRSRAVASKENTISILEDVYAPGNYRVGARFVGAVEGDELELWAYGVVQRDFPIE